MKKLSILLPTISLFILSGCEDESVLKSVDSTGPAIVLTAPVIESEFYPNQYVPVKATITDETLLDQVIISFTGPGNLSNTYTRKDGEGGISFEDKKIDHLDFTFLLPANSVPGNYLITLKASDQQGNKAADQAVPVIVLEDDLENPAISITEPVEKAGFAPEEVITISATVTDNRKLENIRVSLAKKGSEPIFKKSYQSFDSDLSHTVSEPFKIPKEAPFGEYILEIEGGDQKGNTQSGRVTVSIVEASRQE